MKTKLSVVVHIPNDREQCSDPSRTAFCLMANSIPEHPEQKI